MAAEVRVSLVEPECGDRAVRDQGFLVAMNDWPDVISSNASTFVPLL